MKNDRDLGVKDGTLGTIIGFSENTIKVELDRKDENEAHIVHFITDRYDEIDYGYAATIHKGQGVTVDRSYLLTSKYLDRHATYVAMTRHSESIEIFWSREEFPDYKNLINSLSREKVKDSTLDYLSIHDFVEKRGIELMGGFNTFESYPSQSNNESSFIIPAGYEDLFTPDIISKNQNNKNNFDDLFIGLNQKENSNTLEITNEKDLEY